MRFGPGSVLRYEYEPDEWAVVLVLDDLGDRALQRCLCLDGARRFTSWVGCVDSWNLSSGVGSISRIA